MEEKKRSTQGAKQNGNKRHRGVHSFFLVGIVTVLLLQRSLWSSFTCLQDEHMYAQSPFRLAPVLPAEVANKTLPLRGCPKGSDITCTKPSCSRTIQPGIRSVAMCMIVKDEEAYIDEFIDYHHALGFDAFYVYDNSDDFSLRQWGWEKGCHVEVVHYPGVAMQWTAYHHCAAMALENNHTWVALFDPDEILILKKHANIHVFLEDHCQSGALGINWLVFGTGERLTYSPQPFTKRFQFRKRKPEALIKSIVRLSDLDLTKGTIRTHYPYLKPGFSQHDTQGRNFSRHSNPAAPIDVAVLHHYRYKSFQEYVQKRERGQVTFERGKGEIGQLIEEAKRGIVPAARWFDPTGWQKMKEYVPRYAGYDVIYPENSST